MRAQPPANLDAIVEEYRKIIRSIAGEIHCTLPLDSAVRFDDLVSAGTSGLVSALQKISVSRGQDAFRAYAKLRIRGAMLDSLRAIDPLKRGERQRAKLVQSAIASWQQRYGRSPIESEIATETGLSVESVRAARAFRLYALDAIGSASVIDRAPLPDEQAIQEQLRQRVRENVDRLPARHRSVVQLYYDQGLTMRQVGERLGIAESRVSQIHKQAIDRLRVLMANPCRPAVAA